MEFAIALFCMLVWEIIKRFWWIWLPATLLAAGLAYPYPHSALAIVGIEIILIVLVALDVLSRSW